MWVWCFLQGIAGSSRAHAVHATWLNTWMSEWLDLTVGRTWIAIWRTPKSLYFNPQVFSGYSVLNNWNERTSPVGYTQ
jgi:hypothetical protein